MGSTKEVLQHHLNALSADVDTILKDYTEASVLIGPEVMLRGLSEIRSFFVEFMSNLPEGLLDAIVIRRQEIDGELAYIFWDAKPWMQVGTDTFIIRDGKILYQTFAFA